MNGISFKSEFRGLDLFLRCKCGTWSSYDGPDIVSLTHAPAHKAYTQRIPCGSYRTSLGCTWLILAGTTGHHVTLFWKQEVVVSNQCDLERDQYLFSCTNKCLLFSKSKRRTYKIKMQKPFQNKLTHHVTNRKPHLYTHTFKHTNFFFFFRYRLKTGSPCKA